MGDGVVPLTYVLLSGGMDSAACAAYYLDLGRPVRGLFVDFGQPASRSESISAQAVAAHYGFPLDCARLRGDRVFGQGEIKGRNGYLLLTALMLCPSHVAVIAMGIHSGTQYYDCTPSFVDAINAVFDGYTDGQIRFEAPFLDWEKPLIWAYCRSRGVPVQFTYSCEARSNRPCGECLSCIDRRALDAGSS